MWGISTPLDAKVRIAVVGLCFACIGVASVESWRYVDRKREAKLPKPLAQTVPTESPTAGSGGRIDDRPHLQPMLILDSVSRHNVAFHFELENIGDVSVDKIWVQYNNENFTATENARPILERMLPPKGKLTVQGTVRVFDPNKLSHVMAALHYRTPGDNREFTSTFWFTVNPDKAKSIAPDVWAERDGSVGDQYINDELVAKLHSPQGGLFMPVYEMANGKPNLVTVQDARKLFIFDPVSRKVSYSVKMDSGKMWRFQLPLLSAKSIHTISFTWDYSKEALLGVDGVIQGIPLEKR